MRGSVSKFFVCLALFAGLVPSEVGCTARHYLKSADKEAYRLIQTKTPAVPNMELGFSIETKGPPDLSDLIQSVEAAEFLGSEGLSERGAKVLPLLRALEIAVYQSREHQLRKEQLYLEALQLSLSQHRFRPAFQGNLQADYQTRTIPADKVTVGVDAVTGQPRVFVDRDAALVESSLVRPSGSINAGILLASGARLTAAFTSDFLRFVTGDPMPEATASAVGQLIQPLWRGAGYKVTLANLVQAERDLLYAMRDFTAWRKDFAVQVVSDYFSVLQARDTIRNSWEDLKRSRQNVERESAFAKEGQRPLASLDQLRQQELNSETRWLEAIRNYRDGLDRFKISLGLPVGTELVLSDDELSQLRIFDPGMKPDEATQIAKMMRLDLQNTHDRVQDAERNVLVAKNQLRPGVDLVARASMDRRRTGQFVLPDPNQYRWSAGLNVDLPWDRKSERNSYRGALIGFERSKRALSLAEDQLQLQINSGLRALEQARRNFENAELGVKLAERRVEEQQLRMELGRDATVRNLLDAQSDLNQARNGRTGALVGHATARLRFFRDLGILYIKPDGHWEDLPHVETK